jgi:hypothetical protein
MMIHSFDTSFTNSILNKQLEKYVTQIELLIWIYDMPLNLIILLKEYFLREIIMKKQSVCLTQFTEHYELELNV